MPGSGLGSEPSREAGRAGGECHRYACEARHWHRVPPEAGEARAARPHGRAGAAAAMVGAPGGTRTPTPLRAADFESAASTGSATGARSRALRLGLDRVKAAPGRARPRAPAGLPTAPRGHPVSPTSASSCRARCRPARRTERSGRGRARAGGVDGRAARPGELAPGAPSVRPWGPEPARHRAERARTWRPGRPGSPPCREPMERTIARERSTSP